MLRRALLLLGLALILTAVSSADALACPADPVRSDVPQTTRDHVCGAWNATGDAKLGTPLNETHPWATGYIRDFDGGTYGRGGIMERHGVGWAYVVAGPFWQTYLAVGGAPGPLGFPQGRFEASGHLNVGSRENEYMTFEGGVINRWSGGTFATWGQILARWNQSCSGPGQCNVAGPLGRPLSNEQDTAIGPYFPTPGRYSKFEHGIINHSRYGTHVVFGGILRRYAELSYSGGHLGLPTGEEQAWFAGGVRQDFEGGYVYWHPGDAAGHTNADCPISAGDGASGVRERLCAAWSAAGFPNLGHPVNAIHRWGAGWIVDFDGGNWGRGGIMLGDGQDYAFVVGQPFFDALVRAGGAPKIGYPHDPSPPATFGSHMGDNPATGSRYMTFTGGVINSSGHGTFATYGAIRARWEAMNHVNGTVGLPTSDEGQTARVAGRFQSFVGGNLIYDPATGKTWHVYGGILNKYHDLGYSQHPLGLPTDDRRSGPRNEYQTFQGGVINQYDGKAFETHGAIFTRWVSSGSAGGELGLPTSDERETVRSPQGTIGRFSTFEHGVINYNPKVDRAVVLFGAIGRRYADLGYSGSYLGLPTGEEYSRDGSRRQDFEGGYLLWNPGWADARTDRELDAAGTPDVRPPAPVPPSTPGQVTPPPSPESPGFRFRAIGDSVTAGFGIHPDGSLMGATELPGCRPPNPPDGRCSSPTVSAYPALYAQKHGIKDFLNLAMAGATPEQWIENGAPFRLQLENVIRSNPDMTVMTLGANPMLSDAVFGWTWACIRGDHTNEWTATCVEAALKNHQVVGRLERIYTRLIREAARNHLVVLPYHFTVPLTLASTGDRVRLALSMLNGAVAEAVVRTRNALPVTDRGRLRFVPLPSFDGHGCGAREPWVIVNDTCIHPNHLGHQQFANAIDHVYRDNRTTSVEATQAPVRAASATTSSFRLQVAEPVTVYASAKVLVARAAARKPSPNPLRWVVRVKKAGTVKIKIPLHGKRLRDLRRQRRRLAVELVVVDSGGNAQRETVTVRI
jgi:uncharacterized protein with LGFP repeats/lysophospholipase L1-like esterase